ncbi:MAG TPA: sulfite exporter TauE/SafE family protein [Casimicrobiaceae bacterium]|nr:sulfite exporter TauE/SafE family protein [Casimicrobiaceae bacterium]
MLRTSPLFLARSAFVLLVAWACYEFAGFLHGDDQGTLPLAVAGIIAISALVASIVGFAFCALAGSAFAYLSVDPVEAVRTMTVCSTAIQLYAVWRIRHAIRWSALRPMLAAGAFMVPVGVWLLLHVDAALYGVGLGVFLSAYGLLVVFRRNDIVVSGSPWRDAGAGALGGLAGGLAGLSGSFVTIWCSMRGWDKGAQRAVYQPFILVMQVWTLVCLRWLASRHVPLFEGFRFVPFALLAGIAGFAIYERLSHAQFRAVVSVLLILSGFGLLARAL